MAPAQPAALAPPEVVVEVRVHGNYSIPDGDVIRLAGIAPGDLLGPGAVESIEGRLRQSDRFDGVEVRKRYRSFTATQDVALILVVRERASEPTGNVLLRTGQVLARKSLFMPVVSYAEGYGFTYGVRASTLDLFGAGEQLSIPLTWGGNRRAAVELNQAFERGTPGQLRAGVGVSSREHPHFEVDDRRVELWAGVDVEVVDGLRLGGDAGWTDIEFDQTSDRFATYGLNLSFDTRHDPTFPRDAVFAEVRRTWLAPAAFDAVVGRTRVDLRGYKGAFGQAVVSVRGLYEGADKALPAYEQPLLGGGPTVRGYSFGQFAGDSLAVASAELRLPLTSPMNIGNAGVTVFYDTGAAYDVGQRLRKTRFHQGVGAGLFLIATVFQLKLDVAKGFDDGTHLHLSAGFQF
ncbi:MAG: BamA/TamA family outer membrane protein [Dehalococcoidia bacterium]|nr:BamA/TamA family outer membrane protein [Dehalococcoidia bacterium]